MLRPWPTLLLLAACAAPAPFDPQTGEAVDGIVGGVDVLDGGYSAVFMMRMEFDNNTRAACTATLITPRSLLTAAHCVDPRKAGATSVQLFAVNLPVAPISTDPAWVQLVDSRFHPSYVPNNLLDNDIAVVLLPAASTVTPIPYNSASVTTLVGQPLTAVGYGITDESANDFGTRRAVGLTFRSVNATHIALGDQVAKGICDGDSGGPSLYKFPDGVTRVVGVHNYKQPPSACHDGLDTRVDLFAAFVKQWISDKEGPTCGEDGLCKMTGCTPVDPDCAPVVPPPTVQRGQPCSPGTNVCVAGTACVDLGGGKRCTNSCFGFVDCQQGEECAPSDGGQSYCKISDITLRTFTGTLGPADTKPKGGCSAAPATLVPSLLALLALRRRRAR